MPSPDLCPPAPYPARAPFRLLAKAGEAAGRAGVTRENCPFGDKDERSVPWLDGWGQGRRAREREERLAAVPAGKTAGGTALRRCRLPGCTAPVVPDPARTERQNGLVGYCCPRHKARACYLLRLARAEAAALAALREARGKAGELARVTKRKEPGEHPAVVGPCRVCGAPIPWNEAKTAFQNLNSHYCGDEHKQQWRRRVRAARSARERAEVAAGTRPSRRGGDDKSVPDRCEEEAARLAAYWSALGYDIHPRVESIPLDADAPRTSHGTRQIRRVVSDLVGGLPPRTSWAEVERRRLALAARTDGALGRG